MNRKTVAIATVMALATVGVSSSRISKVSSGGNPLQKSQTTLQTKKADLGQQASSFQGENPLETILPRKNEDSRQKVICFDIPYWPWVICF